VLDPVAFCRAIVAPTARGEVGQRLDRRLGIAEAAQQLRIADGPDVGGPKQANAGESFFLTETHLPLPTLGSSPAMSRRIFARCCTSTIAAITMSTGTMAVK